MRSSGSARSFGHGGTVFTSITAGALHTCGIDTSNQGYCWGNCVVGQTGLGEASAYVPTALTAGRAEFSKIDGGMFEFSHSCGRGTDGFAYCWGGNDDGQLGRVGLSVDIPTYVIE